VAPPGGPIRTTAPLAAEAEETNSDAEATAILAPRPPAEPSPPAQTRAPRQTPARRRQAEAPPPDASTIAQVEADTGGALALRLTRWKARIAQRHPTVAIVAVSLLLVIAVALFFSRRPTTEPQAATLTAQPLRPAASALPGRSGRLVVNTHPWGRVVAIAGEASGQIELPADPATPLVLELPAGRYRVRVSPFDAPETELECVAFVATSAVGVCRLEPRPVDPIAYFKEAGWWN
jgi:hypothetical protein